MSAACRADQRPNRTRRSRAALLTAGAAVAALVLSACGSGGTSGGSGNTNFIAGKNGVDTASKGDRDAVPDLSGKTIDGKQLDVADYKGKVVLVNVWASWCIPCKDEAPFLEQVWQDNRSRDVVVVGLDAKDFRADARKFADRFALTFPLVYDGPGDTLDGFGVTEENWRDATASDPHFIASETPFYVGRAVAALAADPNVAAKAGRVFSSWDLAREYGFTDVDGRKPHWGEYFEETFGEYKKADEAAYATWFNGPMDLASPDWPRE